MTNIVGDQRDGYALIVTDQSGQLDRPEDCTIVPLVGRDVHGLVARNPTTSVLSSPYGVDLDGLSANHHGLELTHAVPKGALVRLYDAETERSTCSRTSTAPSACPLRWCRTGYTS